MNLSFEDYVKKLGIENLSHEDQVDSLYKLAEVVHAQFLMELSQTLDKDKMDAVKTSIPLGADLYVTTLKHLAPNYMEIFERVRGEMIAKLNPAV